MRMMLRFTLPVEKSNAAINDGSLGRTMEFILSKLKPEAAYFAPLDGKRAGMIFFDMAEPSQIIEAVEPLFLSLKPSRPGEFHPEPLTDPDLTLSRHPARATARRLPPSIEYRVPPVAG